MQRYQLEIYEPGSHEEVFATLDSDQPFLTVTRGDLIDPRSLDGGNRILPDHLRVVRIEHIFVGPTDTKHKVCVYTERADGGSDPDAQLSRKDRWLFSNILRLLESSYPSEASELAVSREGIESGYELQYSVLFDSLLTGLTASECREVIDILNMYRAITFSAQRNDQIQAIGASFWYPFPGFDGNNETAQMAYCRYFVNRLDRFGELVEHGARTDFNSHTESLPKYRAMLSLWDTKYGRSFDLSQEAIEALLAAR